jgi:hypothetical protein
MSRGNFFAIYSALLDDITFQMVRIKDSFWSTKVEFSASYSSKCSVPHYTTKEKHSDTSTINNNNNNSINNNNNNNYNNNNNN